MTGEQLAYAMEVLFKSGALDVFFTNIIMKKNRPGVKLSVLCHEDKKDKLSELIFKNTSTFGIRYDNIKRDILDRQFVDVSTKWGNVRVKLGLFDGQVIKYAPEYEDCKLIAEKFNMPILDVYNDVLSQSYE